MRNRLLGVVAAAACIGAASSSLPASETDQFLLPVGARFADMGRYFNAVHYRVLEDAVEVLNRRIDAVRWKSESQQGEAELRQFHDPRAVAQVVRYLFPQGWIDTFAIEAALYSSAAQEAFPGELTAYRRRDWIYHFGHLPFDPRNIPMLAQSSTVKLYGVYLGTDKLGHFHDLGHIYYQFYMGQLALGLGEEESMARTVREFSRGIVSEAGIVGIFACGVFSNADLASNYLGMKFYQNLTEPVMLKGELRPPMLVRVGDHWRLNLHVRPESDFFSWFISDHLNEALNPNWYDPILRIGVRRRLTREAADIVAFWAEGDGRPRCAVYFDDLARELSTYYGEDYGFWGEIGGNLMSIGSTIIPALDGTEVPPQPVAAREERFELPAWVQGVSLGAGALPREDQWVRGRRLGSLEMEVAAGGRTDAAERRVE